MLYTYLIKVTCILSEILKGNQLRLEVFKNGNLLAISKLKKACTTQGRKVIMTDEVKSIIKGMEGIIDKDLKDRGINLDNLHEGEREAIYTFYFGAVSEYLRQECGSQIMPW